MVPLLVARSLRLCVLRLPRQAPRRRVQALLRDLLLLLDLEHQAGRYRQGTEAPCRQAIVGPCLTPREIHARADRALVSRCVRNNPVRVGSSRRAPAREAHQAVPSSNGADRCQLERALVHVHRAVRACCRRHFRRGCPRRQNLENRFIHASLRSASVP